MNPQRFAEIKRFVYEDVHDKENSKNRLANRTAAKELVEFITQSGFEPDCHEKLFQEWWAANQTTAVENLLFSPQHSLVDVLRDAFTAGFLKARGGK